MLSKEWVYENIFKMSNEEIDRQKGNNDKRFKR